jgi:hypothetical protein
MLIDVTQEDIDNGKALNAESCPIALATKRLYPGKKVIVVIMFGFPLLKIESYNPVTMPGRCYIFMRMFDNYKKVEPFQFETKDPQPKSE